MAKLPSHQDLGVSPVPRSERPVLSYRGGLKEGQQEEAHLREAQAAQQVTMTGMQVFDQISTRNEAVNRAKAINELNEKAGAEYRRLQTEGDFSDEETTRSYARFLTKEIGGLTAKYGGRPDSQAMLAERLQGIRTHYVTNAGHFAAEQQAKVVDNTLAGEIAGISKAVVDNPGNLGAAFKQWDAAVGNMAPALRPEQELQYIAQGRQQLTLNAVGALLDTNNARGARKLLDESPDLARMLSPDQQRQINHRISSIERAEENARNAGLRKIEEATQILGRAPTLAERMRLAGLGEMKAEETPATKLANMEKALGRPLKEEEKTKALGIFIEQKADTSSVDAMRKEFTGHAATFTKVRDAFNRIKSITFDETGTGDIALIYSFMKMNDPETGIKEGEIALAQQAGSVPERVITMYNNVIRGDKLSPTMREDFKKQAAQLYGSHLDTQKSLEDTYRKLAKGRGYNPDEVVVDLKPSQTGTMPGAGGGGGGNATTPRVKYDMNGNRVGMNN